MASTLLNGNSSSKPFELAFPMPRAPTTHIHIQLTNSATSLLLFLTSSTTDSSGESAPMGSLVYAMPNSSTPTQPLSTTLYTQSYTLDFTTRLAKLLARKLAKPVYVGNSISFASAGMGGTVEEEMEGFRRVVEVVLGVVKKRDQEVSAREVEDVKI
ncbi:hypothetical protein GQ43DRAFT_447677 [Delitschia confertaspora ATCC 74209]|uniref:Uncharacterized protein n=1 Tax=Delitschia confertaspora ATCC 74209 TaxID=1513339 RepID=A0A9P4JQ30_9PLEO|nr:hypothetical protein GQ43DRAFT_447677 [Delitschia confertaspora ATCC 74209]